MAYDPNFLANFEVPLPVLRPTTRAQAFRAGEPIDYEHHSLIFNQVRRFATLAAHNVDGANIVDIERDTFVFDRDPSRIPVDLQVGNRIGYANNPWDKGHLARSKTLHWPNVAQARRAERDGALYPNAFPQHHRMNQGPWALVEDWIKDLATDEGRRVCVFTGPVFSDDDPVINQTGSDPIQIPVGAWKVAAFERNHGLCVVALLMWQRDIAEDGTGSVAFDPVLEQVRVRTIEHLAGICFAQHLRDADPIRFGVQEAIGAVTSRASLCVPPADGDGA